MINSTQKIVIRGDNSQILDFVLYFLTCTVNYKMQLKEMLTDLNLHFLNKEFPVTQDL